MIRLEAIICQIDKIAEFAIDGAGYDRAKRQAVADALHEASVRITTALEERSKLTGVGLLDAIPRPEGGAA